MKKKVEKSIIYKQEEEEIDLAKFEREIEYEYSIKKEVKIKNIKEK